MTSSEICQLTGRRKRSQCYCLVAVYSHLANITHIWMYSSSWKSHRVILSWLYVFLWKKSNARYIYETPQIYKQEVIDLHIINMLTVSFSFCSRLEVVINYLYILYPKLCKHWNVVWLIVAAIIIFAVLLGIYHSYSSCDEVSERPEGKASCSAAHQYSWWNSGFQHEQRTE